MVRKRNSSGQVLKSAARDGDSEGPANGSLGARDAVMPRRLGQGCDENPVATLRPGLRSIDRVEQSIGSLLGEMPRRDIIGESLRRRGALIQVKNLAEACEIANRIAPEHLELSVADPKRWLPKIRHAGAIFLGRYASEALGDYCAGPNHVLPTSRTARFSSPLGVYDFQKRSSVIAVSRKGAQKLGRIAAALAEGEGLQAHARSAQFRLDGKPRTKR